MEDMKISYDDNSGGSKDETIENTSKTSDIIVGQETNILNESAFHLMDDNGFVACYNLDKNSTVSNSSCEIDQTANLVDDSVSKLKKVSPVIDVINNSNYESDMRTSVSDDVNTINLTDVQREHESSNVDTDDKKHFINFIDGLNIELLDSNVLTRNAEAVSKSENNLEILPVNFDKSVINLQNEQVVEPSNVSNNLDSVNSCESADYETNTDILPNNQCNASNDIKENINIFEIQNTKLNVQGISTKKSFVSTEHEEISENIEEYLPDNVIPTHYIHIPNSQDPCISNENIEVKIPTDVFTNTSSTVEDDEFSSANESIETSCCEIDDRMSLLSANVDASMKGEVHLMTPTDVINSLNMDKLLLNSSSHLSYDTSEAIKSSNIPESIEPNTSNIENNLTDDAVSKKSESPDSETRDRDMAMLHLESNTIPVSDDRFKDVLLDDSNEKTETEKNYQHLDVVENEANEANKRTEKLDFPDSNQKIHSAELEEKITIGIKSVHSLFFDVKSKLLGIDCENINFIQKNTGSLILLRGKGSSFIEANGKESEEPLHFYVKYKNKQSRDRSRQMLLNLISGVQKQFLQAHGYLYNSVITPPKIWPVSSKIGVEMQDVEKVKPITNYSQPRRIGTFVTEPPMLDFQHQYYTAPLLNNTLLQNSFVRPPSVFFPSTPVIPPVRFPITHLVRQPIMMNMPPVVHMNSCPQAPLMTNFIDPHCMRPLVNDVSFPAEVIRPKQPGVGLETLGTINMYNNNAVQAPQINFTSNLNINEWNACNSPSITTVAGAESKSEATLANVSCSEINDGGLSPRQLPTKNNFDCNSVTENSSQDLSVKNNLIFDYLKTSLATVVHDAKPQTVSVMENAPTLKDEVVNENVEFSNASEYDSWYRECSRISDSSCANNPTIASNRSDQYSLLRDDKVHNSKVFGSEKKKTFILEKYRERIAVEKELDKYFGDLLSEDVSCVPHGLEEKSVNVSESNKISSLQNFSQSVSAKPKIKADKLMENNIENCVNKFLHKNTHATDDATHDATDDARKPAELFQSDVFCTLSAINSQKMDLEKMNKENINKSSLKTEEQVTKKSKKLESIRQFVQQQNKVMF